MPQTEHVLTIIENITPMASDNQIAANRENAKKSTGPLSPEGKQRVSQNNLRHGMLANTVVLDAESKERFDELLNDLQEELHPQTPIEFGLVENMAIARWRQRRLQGMNNAALNSEIRKQEIDPDNPDTLNQDAATRAHLAFRTLTDQSRSTDCLHRYETRYDREYYRALERLAWLRRNK